jgi:hypothetical protein
LVYEITTSDVFSDDITVSLNVPNVADAASWQRALHSAYENGVWNASNNGAPQYGDATRICKVSRTVSSLSPSGIAEQFAPSAGSLFAVARLVAPTAAGAIISGRATTTAGRAIRGVVVSLTDSDGNVRTATTTSFGYYRFENVATGETYIISAKGKRFTFEQSSRVFSANDDVADVNFIGYER